jgi:hypothetical protein
MRILPWLAVLAWATFPNPDPGAGARPDSGQARSGRDNVVAFVGVTALPMTSDTLLADYTVIVRGDRISAIGPTKATAVPSGAERIDGRNKFLMPGLIEMHTHIPAPTEPKDYIDSVLTLFLANGVTTVRNTVGFPGQLALRDQANRGEILSPTIYSAGPSIEGDVAHSPADLEQLVRRNRTEGWDFFKVLPGITLDDYRALVRTARDVGAPFGGHVPVKVGLQEVLDARQPVIDHLDGYLSYLNAYREPLNGGRLDAIAEATQDSLTGKLPNPYQ